MTGRSWFADLLELAMPAGCVACREWIPGGHDLVCVPCRSRLREASWPRCPRCHHPRGTGRTSEADCLHCREWPDSLTEARCAYVLAGPAADLVHALKYEGWRELAGFMAGPMTRTLDGSIEVGRTVVVPVPTTSRRVRSRGYNQAGLLARAVAERLDVGCHDALSRASGRASQTTLTPAERRRNVRGAFVPSDDARSVVGRDVLLVDDVLTTGATAGEAARVLAGLGARGVRVLAFARTLPDVAARAA